MNCAKKKGEGKEKREKEEKKKGRREREKRGEMIEVVILITTNHFAHARTCRCGLRAARN